MKKVILFLTVCVLTAGLFPGTMHQAYAADPYLQAPVSDLTVTDVYTAVQNAYNVLLRWTQPLNYTPDSGADAAANPPNPEFAERFDLYYRNATQRQSQGPVRMQIAAGTTYGGLPYSYTFNNLALDANSLYEFTVTPIRNNRYRMVDATGNVAYQSRQAQVDSNAPVEQRGLYLTDIKATATGSGNQLTVNWYNPTLDGTDVFTGYDIYYQLRTVLGNEITGVPYTVSLSDPNLVVNRDGTLQYTILDSNLQIGQWYSVKVEPRVGSLSVRKDGVTRVTVNNKSYTLAYKPFDHEYRYDEAYVKPTLNVTPEGNRYVMLTWDALVNRPTSDSPARVEVYESTSPDMSGAKQIGNIDGSAVYYVNYWLADKPETTMYYQIIIYDRDGNQMLSEIRSFDPVYGDFAPYKPDLLNATANLTPRNLDITWLAFARMAYNASEEASLDTTYGSYIDRNMIYDIYVTDAYENFNDAYFSAYPVATTSARNLTLQPWPDSLAAQKSPSYNMKATQYYTRDPGTGTYVSQPLADNKVYYVKIVATRDPGGQVSQPAYGSVYMPSAASLELDPQAIAAPPLRVTDITATFITVTWDTKYLEVYWPDKSDPGKGTWHAVLGVDASGKIIYGKSAMDMEDSSRTFVLNDLFSDINTLNTQNPAEVYQYLENAKTVIAGKLRQINASAAVPNPMTLRIIDLTGASYEIHTVGYDAMMMQGGYEAYLQSNLTGSTGWTPAPNVTPGTLKTGSLTCTVVNADAPTPGPLAVNTAYVIYMRPYVTLAGGTTRVAYYPNYVMATTLDVRLPVEIDPTTPVLRGDSVTDMSVTVYWPWLDLEYDLAYADRLSSYPNGGTVLPWSVISQTANVRESSDGNSYMYFTVPDLFPDTVYYFWVRARAVNATGSKNSEWSNPIDMETLDIQAPQPPTGLGPAGRDHVNTYNKLNATNYAPTEENALVIEWMRDSNDTAAAASGGNATGGTATQLPLAELLNMYMVRFDGLIANRSYYIRAKTVLTVTRTGTANTKTYNYVVQVSLDTDFKDVTEFTIPVMPGTTDPVYTKQKESNWCTVVRLVTARTNTEYDGDVNPDQYPLPAQDWEITYDAYTGTLTHRFRSNQTDASGVQDQQADQRLISRLLAERTYVYKVDVTSYGSRTVNNRVLEVPYSLMKAFDERKITMEVTAGNVVLSIAPGSFDTSAVRALPDMGVGARVRLTVSAGNTGTPTLSTGDSYLSAPQKVSAQVLTPTRTVTVENFAKPVSVKMALNSRVTPLEKNTGLYTSTANSGGWSALNSQYDANAATLSAGVYTPGSFAVIVKSTPASATNATAASNASRDAMFRVTAKVNITDMARFNASDIVTPNQFNNLVTAVALNRSSTAINTAPSAADTNALNKAKLMVAGSVTREAAISALVTLYELKTKQIVPTDYASDVVPYTDMASVSDEYRQNLMKAVNIGFINGTVQPKNLLSMGDLMQMTDIILQDAGQ